MDLPPISGPSRQDFVNPYTSIESVISTLENCLTELVNKINAVVVLANKDPDIQVLSDIANLIHTMEQCSTDAGKSVGNQDTIATVREYIKELFHALSCSEASILTAVAEDAKQNSSEHLKKTLATFAKMPLTSRDLVYELEWISKDLHALHHSPPRPRQVG